MSLIVSSAAKDKTGTAWTFEIDDTEASRTERSPRVDSWRLDTGQQSSPILQVAGNKAAEVSLVLQTEAQHEDILGIAEAPSRRFRLDVYRGAETTPRFRGFCLPEAIDTRVNEQRSHVVTVRAKDRLRGLGDDWLDAGSKYTGDLAASTVIADILSTLGHGLPIEVVMDWRPGSMGGSDDPLSLQVPASAFYREDQNGNTRPKSRKEVLEDVVGRFNAVLRQSRQSWQIVQPAAFESGSDVVVWEYDANGTLQTDTKRAATVDVTEFAYIEESDNLDAAESHRRAKITYEHGAPDAPSFNGDFEATSGWDLTATDDHQYNVTELHAYDGTKSMEATEEQVAHDSGQVPSNFDDASNDYVEHAMGEVSVGAEAFVLTLRAFARKSGGGSIGSGVDASRMFWAIRIQEPGGQEYWWDEAGGQWATNVTNIKNDFQDANLPPAYETETYTIASPPVSGSLYIQLWQPVSKPVDGTVSYTLLGHYDGLKFEREADGASEKTTTLLTDESAAEGEVFERSFRIGDGPWKESQGGLLDDSGTLTRNWEVLGESGTYYLGRLQAREAMKLLGASRHRQRLTFARDQVPVDLATVAVLQDGTRFWPVETRFEGPDASMTVTLVRLLDVDISSWAHDIIAGDGQNLSEPTGGGSGGTSGGTSGVETWDELSGKPSGLFAKGGDSDGFGKTIALPAEASSFLPGPMPGSGHYVFQKLFRHAFDVTGLTIYAYTAPSQSGGFDFEVRVNGTTQTTVTLGQGTNQDSWSLSFDVGAKERLEVVPGQAGAADDLADVAFAFELEPS